MNHKRKRFLLRAAILVVALILLEFFPGSYPLDPDDAQDDFEPGSWEGLAVLALSSAELEATLYFEHPTRHRINRNSELKVPAGATLTLQAWSEPRVIDGEVVARVDRGTLRSDKALTYIYRGVTIARARTLETRQHGNENRLEVVGQYRVLSALATSFRYKRQKEIRRDYQAPTRAEIDFTARIRPDHSIALPGGPTLTTGNNPGRIRLSRIKYNRGQWMDGRLEIDVSLQNPEPALQEQLGKGIPNRFPLNDSIALELKRLHGLRFHENGVDLEVDGEFELSDAFQPNFKSKLRFALDLPREVSLDDARAGVRLDRVIHLDINRVNPIIDSLLRGVLESNKDELATRTDAGDATIEDLPFTLFIRELTVTGAPDGGPQLSLDAELR